MKPVRAKRLFYRVVPFGEDSLVFAPPAEARKNEAIRKAFDNSKTWGEFRQVMPEREYAELMAEYAIEGEPAEVPRDDAPFDTHIIAPGWLDGTYPTWWQSIQEEIIPSELLAEFGVRENSRVSGDFWLIDTDYEQEIITALRERGFKVDRRDDIYFF